MLKDEAERFEKAMEAFQWGFQQDVLAYMETLNTQGYTLKDLKDYKNYQIIKMHEEEKTVMAEMRENNVTADCPDCPALMFAYPVNTEPGNQTDDPTDMSVWVCQNQECMHTIYNKETVDEIIRKE